MANEKEASESEEEALSAHTTEAVDRFRQAVKDIAARQVAKDDTFLRGHGGKQPPARAHAMVRSDERGKGSRA